MNEFKIDNLNVRINGNVILSDFSFVFQKSICVLGESGVGKTTLLHEIFQNTPLEHASFTQFYFGECKRVTNWKESINFETLKEDYKRFATSFFQNKKNIDLKCAIVHQLLKYPRYFFCDDVSLSFSDFKVLVSFLKEKSILFFYVTSDIEKVVFFDYLYVLKNNQIAVEGETLLVMKEEKLMKMLGFSLPFYVNMSTQLGYYGLLQGFSFTKEDMEVALWQSK